MISLFGALLKLIPFRSFSDTKYLRGNDLNFNFCTLVDGEYDLCSMEKVISEVSSPAPAPALTQPEALTQTESDDGGGLAGWAIALIIVLVLSMVCFGGYAVAVMYCGVDNFFKKSHEDTNDIQSNKFMDVRIESTDASTRLAIMDSRSSMNSRKQLTMQHTLRSQHSRPVTVEQSRMYPASRGAVQQVVCSNPQYPSFDDNSFSINTYSTNRRKARDPTVFIPSQDSKPDPGTTSHRGNTHDGENSRRHYSKEPPLKPKRDPTMYVDGKESDFTAVVDDNGVLSAQHGSPHYDIEAIDDDARYVRSYVDPKSLRSQATYSRDGFTPSLFGTISYQTEEHRSTYANQSMMSPRSSSTRRSDKYPQEGVGSTSESSSFSKRSHKSKRSRNASFTISSIFSG